MCGYTAPASGVSRDILIMSLDSTGQSVWEKRIGSDSNTDICKGIVEFEDGIYFAGESRSFSAAYSLLLGKMTLNGNLEWLKLVSGVSHTRSINLHERDGFLIIGGYTDNLVSGLEDYLVIKSDSDGNLH